MSNEQVAMTYAFGFVDSETNVGSSKTFKLGDVNPAWKDYELICYVRPNDMNDRYVIRYNGGPFGVEKNYGHIIECYAGMSIQHIIHLLIQAISVHKAELP